MLVFQLKQAHFEEVARQQKQAFTGDVPASLVCAPSPQAGLVPSGPRRPWRERKCRPLREDLVDTESLLC